MAYQDTIEFSKYLIQLGDGAEPEVFSKPCGLKARTFSLENTPSEVALLDCDDESLPMTIRRVTVSRSGTVSGEGAMEPGELATWRTWSMSGAAKNVRILVDLPAADGGGYYQGPFLLTRFENVSSKEEGVVTFSVEMVTAGAYSWTDAAS